MFSIGNDNYTLYGQGNVYGYNPAYRVDAVVNKLLFQANFLGKITINGSGDQHRSFIHVDKVANAIVRIIDGKIKTGIYNCC
jgi:UDP-glucose 4-epimerase